MNEQIPPNAQKQCQMSLAQRQIIDIIEMLSV